MRRCSTCDQTKPLEDFYKRGDKKKPGVQAACKVCVRGKTLQYKRRNVAKYQGYYLKRSFGMSKEDFNAMFIKQEGLCACCGDHQSDVRRTFSVDHCHRTGRIRALLCQNCNLGIGQFKEDIIRMQKAIAYLQRSNPVLAGQKTNVVDLMSAKK